METNLARVLAQNGFMLQEDKPASSEHAGTFYRGDFLYVQNTVAFDEEGNVWITEGHVDLSKHGFREFPAAH